jgi:hypothetical protein
MRRCDQAAQTRRELARACQARDDAEITSIGLQLRYLLEIAEEHRVELPRDDQPGAPKTAATDGGDQDGGAVV